MNHWVLKVLKCFCKENHFWCVVICLMINPSFVILITLITYWLFVLSVISYISEKEGESRASVPIHCVYYQFTDSVYHAILIRSILLLCPSFAFFLLLSAVYYNNNMLADVPPCRQKVYWQSALDNMFTWSPSTSSTTLQSIKSLVLLTSFFFIDYRLPNNFYSSLSYSSSTGIYQLLFWQSLLMGSGSTVVNTCTFSAPKSLSSVHLLA